MLCWWLTMRLVCATPWSRSWSITVSVARRRATPKPQSAPAGRGGFDVVVMDIRMPGRDGVSALQQMEVPPPQVILMTAYAQEERLRAAARARVFAVVYKPFDARRMVGLVDDASQADAKASR